ncbi:MAG: Rpn family recombination-promoting nuclease/putative transposase [Clostridiales bacterium]|jgi:hypothetical protein|nr:Rpn family recombination-promoting nuclease/putative transposase [Clostridiales bacterium]
MSTLTLEYKNTIFIDLLSDTANFIQVANAVTDYNIDPKKTDSVRMDGNIFAKKIHDIAYIVKWFFAFFFEHQSTYNPNMPIRMLEYFMKVLNTYMAALNLNRLRYGAALVEKPAFVPIVFYNGKRRLTADQRRIKYSTSDIQPPSYINTSPAATFTCVGGPPTVTLDFEVIVIDLLDPSSAKLLNKSPILSRERYTIG